MPEARTPDRPPAPPGPSPRSREFRDRFGEELRDVLDPGTWAAGFDFAREYARVEAEVREAVASEGEYQRRIRTDVFPKLFSPANAPPDGGVYDADRGALALVHRGLLFNGGVEACDGTVAVHDTLPLTIYQR